MASKKTFLGSPESFFISSAAEPKTQEKKEKKNPQQIIPAGYKLQKETKSRRLQLLIRPTTYKELLKLSKKNKNSVNETINSIIEEYINNGKA